MAERNWREILEELIKKEEEEEQGLTPEQIKRALAEGAEARRKAEEVIGPGSLPAGQLYR